MKRSRELMGESGGVQRGVDSAAALGLERETLEGVPAELENYTPECWHSARALVVRVLAARLRLVG